MDHLSSTVGNTVKELLATFDECSLTDHVCTHANPQAIYIEHRGASLIGPLLVGNSLERNGNEYVLIEGLSSCHSAYMSL